jgi:hypothetical protein
LTLVLAVGVRLIISSFGLRIAGKPAMHLSTQV